MHVGEAPTTFHEPSHTRGCEFAATNLDDLVTHIEWWEEHLAHLQVILCQLEEAGFMARLKEHSLLNEPVHLSRACSRRRTS